MAIIATLSDENLSYNSVKITQTSCFLIGCYGTEPGFAPGLVGWNHSKATKQLLIEHNVSL